MLRKLSRFFRRPRCSADNVYYAKISKSGKPYYIVGFTQEKDVAQCLISSGMSDECSLVGGFFFKFREDAWDVEQDILDYSRKKKIYMYDEGGFFFDARGSRKPKVLISDVLGLDERLYELSPLAKHDQQGSGVGCLLVLVGLLLIPFTAGISIAAVLILIGAYLVYEFVSKHGDELENKRKPQLPSKLESLVLELSGKRFL